MSEPLNIISLGAGVQSTTMALMAAHGEITPMPDCAIHANTQDDGAATERHLQWLKGQLPFPVYEPTRGRLSEALLAGDEMARIPVYIKDGGMKPRQCTRNFKIRVIRRMVREILGVGPRGHIPPGSVIQWIGISSDEYLRVKPSGVAFAINRHPLVDARITREDCKRWCLANGYPIPPKSSCVFCAFQGDAQWRERQQSAPEDFAYACHVDAALRTPENVARFHGETYLHPSRRPLSEIDFNEPSPQAELNLFNNECSGMCGV